MAGEAVIQPVTEKYAGKAPRFRWFWKTKTLLYNQHKEETPWSASLLTPTLIRESSHAPGFLLAERWRVGRFRRFVGHWANERRSIGFRMNNTRREESCRLSSEFNFERRSSSCLQSTKIHFLRQYFGKYIGLFHGAYPVTACTIKTNTANGLSTHQQAGSHSSPVGAFVASWGRTWITLCFPKHPRHGDRVLRVVYNEAKKPITVVTMYFDRTMKGKLWKLNLALKPMLCMLGWIKTKSSNRRRYNLI